MTDIGFPTPAGPGTRTPVVRAGQHVGRPRAITPDMADRLYTALRNGATVQTACELAGLSKETVRKWIYRGEGRERDRPATPEYVEFARSVKENRAFARAYVSASLLDRATVSTKAATDWLDANGDEEWRAARREIREGSDLPSVPPAINVSPTVNVTVGIDAREQNLTVIEIPDDRMPDFLRALIAQSRDDHAAILAERAEPFPEQEVPDGHRSPRIGRLRVSSSG